MAKLPKPLPQIPTRDAVLVSCGVWREQGERFLSRESAGSNAGKIQTILESPQTLGDFLQSLVPKDQQLFEGLSERITQELIQKKLAGTLNDFEQAVLNLIHGESVNYKDSGKLAYLPEMYQRLLTRDSESELFKNSRYLGQPGIKLELDITLVRRKVFQLAQSFGRYRHRAGTVSAMLICKDAEHNMIKIFHQDLEVPQDQSIHIKARVKKHDYDQDFGVPSTILNYVKIQDKHGKI